MFSFLSSIFEFFMYWLFMYVCAIFILIFGITYVIKTNPTPIIHEHNIIQNIIKPTERVLVEREVCKDIRGCEIINGTCPNCVIEKVWEWCRILTFVLEKTLPKTLPNYRYQIIIQKWSVWTDCPFWG